MNPAAAHTQQKRIEDLELKEVDMVFSLARVGEWTDIEIGRRYRLSQADVRKVIDNYEELRKTAKKNSPEGAPYPSTVTGKEERKVGRNARYSSNKERQAAYRARLREKRLAELQSQAPVTDTPAPVEEELSRAYDRCWLERSQP